MITSLDINELLLKNKVFEFDVFGGEIHTGLSQYVSIVEEKEGSEEDENN